MSSLVNLIEKFQYEVQNNKGHRHLYDRFDELLQRLIAGEGKTEDEQMAIESAIDLLLCESDLFADDFGYRYYVIRCYICATKLYVFILNNGHKQMLQHFLNEVIVKIRANQLIPFFPEDFFFEYNNELLVREQFDSVKESIYQCFFWSDSGHRPREYYEEEEMYGQFKRGYKLTKEYLKKTHDYERYIDWFKVLDPIHIGNILASIPEDPEYDNIGDLVDETLTLQIEMLEDWKRNSYDSFVANGGESLLSRCLEY